MRNKFRAYEILPCKMVNVLSAKGTMVSEAAIELRTVTDSYRQVKVPVRPLTF